MKKTTLAALLLAALPFAAQAEETSLLSTTTANVGVVSDYVFRGISQSDENPAIQAGVNIGGATGFYAGLWGSNVDFNDGDEAEIEADISAGYKWALDAATLDIGAIYYAYPGANDGLHYDYIEAKAGISAPIGPVNAALNVYISPDYFASSGTAVYTNASASMPIGNSGFSLNTALGRQIIDDNTAFGVSDYTDWNLGVSYVWEKFTFGVNYYDTSISKTECPDNCDARIVASITRSF